MQTDDCDEKWRIPVARYEDNLTVIAAYGDLRLQPSVVMKRLELTWYLLLKFFICLRFRCVKSKHCSLNTLL